MRSGSCEALSTRTLRCYFESFGLRSSCLLPAGRPTLVTFCRSFHWVDQPTVLRQMDSYVSDGGVVALFADKSFWNANSDWQRAVKGVVQDFLGEQRRAGDVLFSHHDRPYNEILKELPFSDVEEFIVPIRRTWTADSILGYLYSTSFAARRLFDGRVDEFERAIRNVLARQSNRDSFDEDNEFVIRLGRRPRK